MVLAGLGLSPIPRPYWLYNTWNLISLGLGIINKIEVIIIKIEVIIISIILIER